MGDLAEAAVLVVIGGQLHGVFGLVGHRHQHIGQRLVRMEIKGKQQAIPGEDNGLFRILHQPQISHALRKHLILLGQLHHIPVKLTQPLVF